MSGCQYSEQRTGARKIGRAALRLAACLVVAPVLAQPAGAQSADDGFYAGKQVKVIVGFPPGGGAFPADVAAKAKKILKPASP